jgi:hypothetical protein
MPTSDETPDLTETATETTGETGSSDHQHEADPFETGADTFDRSYVEKLRQESASYRTKAKPYEETFGAYSDEDREVWFEAARRFAADPRDGGEYLKQIADAVLAEYQEQQAADDGPITDENDKPLTVAQYRELREAERAQAEQDAEVARIEKRAADLGYDTASEEYTYLLTVASRLPDGDLEKAHAKIQAAEEARFQARLDKMKADAEGSPTAPSAGAGAAPSGERQLKTWRDAELASKARLEAAQIKS